MKTIDADAAKLAGLQIDILSKLRSGQMSIEHLEMFSNLTPEARLERFQDFKKPESRKAESVTPGEKFVELADLGVIVVPDDYVHGKCLTVFGKEHGSEFYYYEKAITDKNFPNPSRVLKPGDKLRVRAWKQVVEGTTTSEERMEFLAVQKSVHVGAQGATLVYKQKRDQLPKGYWYASFDQRERLWKDADGFHGVPRVSAHSDGGFPFSLGSFERVWHQDGAFFSFCDEEPQSSESPEPSK